MIPVLPTDVLKVPDPDGDQVVYHFRYLLDERQPEFFKLYQDQIRMVKALVPEAAKAVDKDHKGKSWGKGERDAAIQHKAQELAFTGVGEDMSGYLVMVNAWLELFLIGWEGKGAPKLPEGMKPSSALKVAQKFKMFGLLQQHLPELVGLSADAGRK